MNDNQKGTVKGREKGALAIHTIGHPSMSRDTVSKVLDVKCSFEARGKESAERSNERGEARQEQQVELVGRIREGSDGPSELGNDTS